MISKILDYGYCELIETWGSDERIIESARMSTSKGFQGWDKDEKLLKYLWDHKHLTPFEMCGATFEIQAPIFVFREWHRHRTQSYNEMSGRYTVLPDLYYLPSVERLMAGRQSTTNKQGSTSGFTEEQAKVFRTRMQIAYSDAREIYDSLIEAGVAREIARTILPVSQFSRMRASANLRNWIQFLDLRCAPDAQWEIRQFANAIRDHLKDSFPRTGALIK